MLDTLGKVQAGLIAPCRWLFMSSQTHGEINAQEGNRRSQPRCGWHRPYREAQYNLSHICPVPASWSGVNPLCGDLSAPAASSRSAASSAISAAAPGSQSGARGRRSCRLRFGTSHADSSGCSQYLSVPCWSPRGSALRTVPAPASPRVPSGGPTTARPPAAALRAPIAAGDCTAHTAISARCS
jgi:hypothetical protein